LKLLNTDLTVPNIYSITPENTRLSINALPFTDEADFIIPLGLKSNQDGFVSFTIKDAQGIFADMRLFLSDMVTGTMQDLLPDQQYEIFLLTGEYHNRFYINAYSSTTDIPEHKPVSDDIFIIYSSNGILKSQINKLSGSYGTLTISNLLGQTLFSSKVYETGYHEFDPIIKDGIFIATFTSGNIKSSRKLFIKN
jgi:hypothetical protein